MLGTIEKHIDGIEEGKIRTKYEKNLNTFKNKFLVIVQMISKKIPLFPL